MAQTNVTTLDSAIQTKFIKKVLDGVKGEIAFPRFASTLAMERGGGDTVRWNRIRRIPRQTSFNLSENSSTTTPKALTTDKIEASIGYVGDSLSGTTASKFTSILEDKAYQDAVKDQIIRTFEYLGLKQISLYSMHHRVDNDSTYEVNADATSAGATTTAISTDLTQSDDHWGTSAAAHGYIVQTNPEAPNYGMAALVTDFTASSDTCTVATWPQVNTTDSNFHLVRGTAIAATDVISVAALARVAGAHTKFQTKRFKGGILRGYITPEQEADLVQDSTYTAIRQYVEGLKELGRYRVVRIHGIELIVVPDGYREDVDGTENASGTVFNTPIFGRDTYNITKWNNGADEFGVKFDFVGKQADSGNYWRLNWWINWHAMCAIATLDACGIVNLMTGATAMPMTL